MPFFRKHAVALVVIVGMLFIPIHEVFAQGFPIPLVDLQVREAQSPQEVSLGLQILFLLTILSLAPSILVMTTSFIRISIVLNFLQRSLSLQETPPRAIVMGLSLFLTFFVMQGTFTEINDKGLQPYLKGDIGWEKLYETTELSMKGFMLKTLNTKTGMNHLDLLLYISKNGRIRELSKSGNLDELAKNVSVIVVVPAFILNELTTAFKMGIFLFIPFIIIDLIVASSLMAMGMIMLPPVMISLPLKILLFVSVDGWKLLTVQLVQSFG